MSRTLNPFPSDTPYDIERAIIECAAFHDQNLAQKLTGLTKEVRTWVDPILYRCVKLEYPSQAEAFIRTLNSSSKDSEFFSRYVRILCFSYGVTLEQVAQILSVCKNVKSLASWIEFSQSPDGDNTDTVNKPPPHPLKLQHFITNQSSQLRRLSIVLQDFFNTSDPDFTLPVIQNLTHLDIYQGSQHFDTWSWNGFSDLTHLTHLSFDLSIASSLHTISDLIPRFPKGLCVCLVLLSTRDATTTLENFFSGNKGLENYISGEADRRVVVGTTEELAEEYRHDGLVVVHPYEEVVKDWTYAPDGKEDIWDKAMSVVVRRDGLRKKKVNIPPIAQPEPMLIQLETVPDAS